MHETLVSDELWEIIEPLLPPNPPKEIGCRPGYRIKMCSQASSTYSRAVSPGECCLRRSGVAAAQRAGVVCAIGRNPCVVAATPHPAGPSRQGRPNRLVEGQSRLCQHPSQKGGEKTGPNHLDRGRPGSKRHLVTDAGGVPLTIVLTGANLHDSKVLEELIDSINPVKGKRGRPRKKSVKLHADKGYDYPRCRRFLRRRGISSRIARRSVENSERLGRYRWVVERTLAWLSRYRRLCVRYERRADIHEAFLLLACALICFGYLQRRF